MEEGRRLEWEDKLIAEDKEEEREFTATRMRERKKDSCKEDGRARRKRRKGGGRPLLAVVQFRAF